MILILGKMVKACQILATDFGRQLPGLSVRSLDALRPSRKCQHIGAAADRKSGADGLSWSFPSIIYVRKAQRPRFRGQTMGIRFACPNGHKLNVKEELAGKRAVCPDCGARFVIPSGSPSHADVRTSATASTSTSSGIGKLQSPTAALPQLSDAALGSPPITPSLLIPPQRPVEAMIEESPPTLTEGPTETAPVAEYKAYRRRRRRRQMTVAIVLLMAVIVLAIVLVWVVQRGPGAGAAQRGNRLLPDAFSLGSSLCDADFVAGVLSQKHRVPA
jgi:hypothetical protein